MIHIIHALALMENFSSQIWAKVLTQLLYVDREQLKIASESLVFHNSLQLTCTELVKAVEAMGIKCLDAQTEENIECARKVLSHYEQNFDEVLSR